MENIYQVSKTSSPIEINADWNKPAWLQRPALSINQHMGEAPLHKPKVEAKLAWDDECVYVIFRVEDKYVMATADKHFDMVCKDSCVEFFFAPRADTEEGYFNLETNCIGSILMFHQYGRQINQRWIDLEDLKSIELATSLPKGKVISPEIKDDTVWTVEYALPWRMLEKYTTVNPPAPGVEWRANFYKCIEQNSHPHWLTWNEIPLPAPDFHQPRHFGIIKFID